MTDRDASIFRRSAEGATLEQICKEHDLGKERVRQIVLRLSRAKRRSELAADAKAAGGARAIPVDCAGLSVRASNALRNVNLSTLGDAADAFMWLQTAPQVVPNFGRMSLLEVRAVMISHGFRVDYPKLSKSAAAILANRSLVRTQDIVRQFGICGPHGRAGRPPWLHRELSHKFLEEIRTIAELVEGQNE